MNGFSKDIAMLGTLVRREFSIRYKDSFLGILWVFAAPLLMIATYSLFMFGVMRGIGNHSQGAAGLAGLWVCLGYWQWLAESTTRAAVVAHENSAMVKKTPLKLGLLPLTSFLVASVGFLLPLVGAVVIVSCYAGGTFSPVFLLIGLLSLLPWSLAIIFFATVLGTFVRDAKHALPIFFNVGMFLSPILYTRDQAPSLLAGFLAFNPLGYHFEVIKFALGDQNQPDFMMTAITTSVGFILCVASALLFKARSGEFADVV
jgi:lipopolysaccharide transport system permease protein